MSDPTLVAKDENALMQDAWENLTLLLVHKGMQQWMRDFLDLTEAHEPQSPES